MSRPPFPATWHPSQTPAPLLLSPAFHHSPFPHRSPCLRPTHTLLGPSSLSQPPHLSTTFLLGSPQGSPHHRAPELGPSHILPGQHLGLRPFSSLFHSSIHTSSHPRPQASCPHRPPIHSQPSLVSSGSHQLPCTPSSTQALPTMPCHPTQGFCPSPAPGRPSLPTRPCPMVPPLLPGPWVPRQPRSPCAAPRLLASPAPVPTWCLHLLHLRALARCPLGPPQQRHLRAHAGAQ